MSRQANDKLGLIRLIRELSAPLPPMPAGVSPELVCLDGVRAVIFDVYGTLFVSGSGDVDSAAAAPAALEAALAGAGFRAIGPDGAERALAIFKDAIMREHRAMKAAGADRPEVDILEIWRDCLSAMKNAGRLAGRITPRAVTRLAAGYECRANPAWPMPGLADTLAGLRAAGMILGIVSNAQFYSPLLFDALLRHAPAELGFEPALTLWSYMEREAKPSARMFVKLTGAAERGFGLRPRDMIFVGNDMLNDIAPAQAAGMRTALFAGDGRSLRMRGDHAACRAVKPDLVLGGLADLPRCLGADQAGAHV